MSDLGRSENGRSGQGKQSSAHGGIFKYGSQHLSKSEIASYHCICMLGDQISIERKSYSYSQKAGGKKKPEYLRGFNFEVFSRIEHLVFKFEEVIFDFVPFGHCVFTLPEGECCLLVGPYKVVTTSLTEQLQVCWARPKLSNLVPMVTGPEPSSQPRST